MTIPATYAIDFTPLNQDLQERAWSRLLLQFRDSPVLCQLLYAIVSEVQALSDAINDTIKYRSLYYGQGDALDIIGRIVGEKRGSSQTGLADIIQETDEDIITETGDNIEAAVTVADTDANYRDLLLLRIISDFNKDSSIPELAASIYQVTGIKVVFQRKGPMSVNILVPADTDPLMLAYLKQAKTNQAVDRSFLFPYPATLDMDVIFTEDIIQETGEDITTEDGNTLSTESIVIA